MRQLIFHTQDTNSLHEKIIEWRLHLSRQVLEVVDICLCLHCIAGSLYVINLSVNVRSENIPINIRNIPIFDEIISVKNYLESLFYYITSFVWFTNNLPSPCQQF